MNKMFAFLAVLAMLFSIGCSTGCSPVEVKNSGIIQSEQPERFQTESFVQIEIGLKDDPRSILGSGGVVDTYKDHAFVLTAAHVCMPDVVVKAHLMTNIPIRSEVIDQKGDRYAAVPVKVDVENDLCIMHAKEFETKALPMSDDYPKVGVKYFNMASPRGIFGGGTVPIFDGYYSGNYTSEYSGDRFDLYSIPVQGGSSGSPIFNKHNEIMGVVSMKFRGFENLAISAKYAKTYNFVQEFKALLEKKVSALGQ